MSHNNPTRTIALDVGERRIGVALADSQTRLPVPLVTLSVDGGELARLRDLLQEHEVDQLVVGLPRNQSGGETAQTAYVRQFVEEQLRSLGLPIIFQDESLTSVLAEEHLKKNKKSYQKGDIDRYAAAIILSDYLEAPHGH